MLTTSLTGKEWLACFGLAALPAVVVETSKWLRRRHEPAAAALDPHHALAPRSGRRDG